MHFAYWPTVLNVHGLLYFFTNFKKTIQKYFKVLYLWNLHTSLQLWPHISEIKVEGQLPFNLCSWSWKIEMGQVSSSLVQRHDGGRPCFAQRQNNSSSAPQLSSPKCSACAVQRSLARDQRLPWTQPIIFQVVRWPARPSRNIFWSSNLRAPSMGYKLEGESL